MDDEMHQEIRIDHYEDDDYEVVMAEEVEDSAPLCIAYADPRMEAEARSCELLSRYAFRCRCQQ